MMTLKQSLAALGLSAAALLVAAQPHSEPAPLVVEGAWARASVQGQSGTGAFMRLTAREPLRLVGVSSPAAGVAEVHEMRMEGDVMRMRAIPALELPVGKPVELKPGGYHLMLMELKAPLKPGTEVAVTLLLRDSRGDPRQLELSVPVRIAAPSGGAPHKH
jgi:periplasmic copper chaperone A